MDFRQLRYFARVAELGSFTAAAEDLHVSQPALGMQVKKLEEDIGAPLLARHSRGAVTTPAGAALLTHALDILQRLESARQAVRRYGENTAATFRVGVTPSIGRALAIGILERATDHLSPVELLIVQAFGEGLADQMLQGKLDFAFTHRDLSDRTWVAIPLIIDNPHIFGHPDVIERLPDPITFAVAAGLPLVLDGRGAFNRRRYSSLADAWNVALRDAIEVDSIDIMRELVLKGNRCSVAPFALFADEVREGKLSVRRIDEPRLTRKLLLNCRRDELMSAKERQLRDMICALVDERIAAGDLRWIRAGANSLGQI
ncbi:MAG: LysR family transcriptional regulator [Rhodobiaceae bacterium]|nr:LysR family transcriptional regulator [Rhodobiaceae bacterium]